LKGNQARNQEATDQLLPLKKFCTEDVLATRGGNRAIAPLNRLCTEDVLHVRNLQKFFLNYGAIEK